MCGIAGAIGNRPSGLIEAMTTALEHRGPDSEGYVHRPSYDLGVRRLSIIDTASGDQPIFSELRDKCIVFNGEIYNYIDLRTKLRALGHYFTTATDTEVVVHAYEEWGEECVEHFRGMFAFAIGDGESVFMARDRLGIKPLYYVNFAAEGLFIFASEIKALLRCESLSLSLEPRAVGDMIVLGHLTGDDSFFREVRALLPGTWMRVRNTDSGLKYNHSRYFALRLDPDASLCFETAEKALAEALQDAVATHVVSDVPVGATLSGGLDSTILTMFMRLQATEKELFTFTIADAEENADLLIARRVAQQLTTGHREHIVDFDDFINEIPACVRALESPNMAALPLYILCSRIDQEVKVVLNGEGADELFGGYSQYLEPSWRLLELQRGLERARDLQLPVSDGTASSVERFSRAQTPADLLAALFELNLGDQLVKNHLEVVDKCSMAFGLEMRVPFMDDRLVDLVRRFPHTFKVDAGLAVGKYILKTAALRCFGTSIGGVVLRQKRMLPQAFQSSFNRFTRMCNERLPGDYVSRHELGAPSSRSPSSGRITTKTELVTFDLFRYIYVANRGVIPSDFNLRLFVEELGVTR